MLEYCVVDKVHSSGRTEWKLSVIDVKMGDFQVNFETDDIVDKLLIDNVRERPSLYYTDAYTGLDEYYWDEIQKNTGIQSLYLVSLSSIGKFPINLIE